MALAVAQRLENADLSRGRWPLAAGRWALAIWCMVLAALHRLAMVLRIFLPVKAGKQGEHVVEASERQRDDIVGERIKNVRAILAPRFDATEMAQRMQFFENLLNRLAQTGAGKADGVASVLGHIGSYWGSAIIFILRSGAYRHATLKRILCAINPDVSISQRILTLNLRNLERDGLVERRVKILKVPQVEYFLTPMGKELSEQFSPVVYWVASRGGAIANARAAFDKKDMTNEM